MGSMEAKDGRKVNFYMVIPAYREEIEYKLEYGMEALDKRFSEGNLPMVLDIHPAQSLSRILRSRPGASAFHELDRRASYIFFKYFDEIFIIREAHKVCDFVDLVFIFPSAGPQPSASGSGLDSRLKV